MTEQAEISRTGGPRLASLDAYRGFVMLAMASGGLGLIKIDDPGITAAGWWESLTLQFDHVAWRGCSFWDMIQPSFMFIVGVALPFSFANRRERGQGWGLLFGHAMYRSMVLVALGVFLASSSRPRTNFLFTNVLAQIGLGYTFVFLLLGRSIAVQALAALAILMADWAFFARFPLPPESFPWSDMGIDANWNYLHGFAAHWEKNSNAAAAFDRWFLNLFPRPDGKPFVYEPGGYTTLNFVPSMATMIFGIIAGEFLRTQRPSARTVRTLFLGGVIGIVVGSLLDRGFCPIVKRIWTPSWTIYSAGWAGVLLAAFHGVIDVLGFRRWAFPLIVVGVNSIAMYMMSQLLKPWIRRMLSIHLGPDYASGAYAPMVESLAVLVVLWLVCAWLYRNRIFVKI